MGYGGSSSPSCGVRGLALAALVLVPLTLPSLAHAGTYSFSFPSSRCEITSGANNPVAAAAAGSSNPTKVGWRFNMTEDPGDYVQGIVYCDVAFPRSVNSSTFNVNLTWQAPVTAPTNNVCWRASWEITKPAQAWATNVGSNATYSDTVTTALADTANVDIVSTLSLIAYDALGAECGTGDDADTCASYHGVLRIERMHHADCSSDTT